jgi:hypothetical protein
MRTVDVSIEIIDVIDVRELKEPDLILIGISSFVLSVSAFDSNRNESLSCPNCVQVP